MKLTSKEIL